METFIALLPSLLALLTALMKAAPSLATAIQSFVTTIKADIAKTELTAEQKATIDSAFDKIDADLQAACEARLALGDQETKE